MILLDNKMLKEVFEDIVKNPKDNEPKERLMKLLEKVIKCTVDRYHQSIRDDISQELLLAIFKKAEYLAKEFCAGNLKNPTNYLFTFMHNNAINRFEKEKTYNTRFVSIEDIKVDKAYYPTTYSKYKVLDRIKEEVVDYIIARFPNKKDSSRAIKYIDCILEGRRPTFKTKVIYKWYEGRQLSAKEAYSIVLNEVKKRLKKYREELVSKKSLE